MKNLFLVFFICFTSFVFAQITADSIYTKAKLKADAKDYTVAAILVEKAIKMNPKEMKYYFFKADMEMELKNYSDAKKAYLQAIQIFPDNSAPYCELGHYFRTFNETDSSLKYINKAIKMAESDSIKFVYYSARASTYYFSRQYDKAQKDDEKILKYNPNNIYALNNLALTYRADNQKIKAIQILKKIISIDSSVVFNYINLGLLYTELDSLKEALTYFDKGVQIDPNEALLYSNRGDCYFKLKQYDKALKDINLSIKLYPTNSWAYKNRAKVYIELNQFSNACKDLETSEKLSYEYNYGDEVKKLVKKHCK